MSKIKLVHTGGNGVFIEAPAANPTADRTLRVSGDADGTLLDSNNITNSSTKGLRNITTSTSAPTGGSDGDIWIVYTD